jgi:hypothetical protein
MSVRLIPGSVRIARGLEGEGLCETENPLCRIVSMDCAMKLRGREKNGTGTGWQGMFSSIRQGWPEPVPIFSRPLSPPVCEDNHIVTGIDLPASMSSLTLWPATLAGRRNAHRYQSVIRGGLTDQAPPSFHRMLQPSTNRCRSDGCGARRGLGHSPASCPGLLQGVVRCRWLRGTPFSMRRNPIV